MEELYIKRVLNGELKAFGYLVRQHQQMAMRTAMALVKNEYDSKDIVQNSFLKAYESLDRFRGDAKFSTWLCRIVVNNSLKFIEKNKQNEKLVPEVNTDLLTVQNQGMLSINREDLEELIKTGLNLLAPKEALTIQLYYLEEYGLEEVIEITGFTKSNVKVLLHRGRKSLYKHLITTYEKIK